MYLHKTKYIIQSIIIIVSTVSAYFGYQYIQKEHSIPKGWYEIENKLFVVRLALEEDKDFNCQLDVPRALELAQELKMTEDRLIKESKLIKLSEKLIKNCESDCSCGLIARLFENQILETNVENYRYALVKAQSLKSNQIKDCLKKQSFDCSGLK